MLSRYQYFIFVLIIISFLFVGYEILTLKPDLNLIFGSNFLFLSSFLILAVLLPELWFIFGDEKSKDFIEKIRTGGKCKNCASKGNVCIGIKCKNESEIEFANINECKKLKRFATGLGFIERFFYFAVLIIFDFRSQFFAIIGAWITLKAAGNNFWRPDSGDGVDNHCKRARFLLFLINSLISIGIVMILFYLAKTILRASNGTCCFYWC